MKYLEFLKYVTKCCQGCNCSKQQITHRNIFYSLSVTSFFKSSSSKASRLLFIFACVSMGYIHFSNDEIPIYCEPDRPTLVLYSCEMAVNTTRKPGGDLLGLVSTQKRNPPLSKSLPVCKCSTGFIFLHMDCFHQLMVCSRGCRKTNEYTHRHIHFLEKNFKKPGTRPQLWARAWF